MRSQFTRSEEFETVIIGAFLKVKRVKLRDKELGRLKMATGRVFSCFSAQVRGSK